MIIDIPRRLVVIPLHYGGKKLLGTPEWPHLLYDIESLLKLIWNFSQILKYFDNAFIEINIDIFGGIGLLFQKQT